jgi:hypothetical protein
MTKKLNKKDGFTLQISSDVANILGVHEAEDLNIIVMDDTVILKAKKGNATHTRKLNEESDKLTKRLMDQYEPVLKKLAKT